MKADREKLAELKKRRQEVIARGHASATNCYVESASGAVLQGLDGRRYIDFAGGIAVMNVGHCHPRVTAAIQEQAARLTHTCFMVLPYEPAVRLAETLCGVVPGNFAKSVLLVNSGAEAVENAVKIVRYATGKPGIITFENAFHGRTQLTMTLTGKVKPYKFGFGPFAPEVYRTPYAYCYRCPLGLTYPGCDIACADYLEEVFRTQVPPESTAAVIAEPVLGEGGYVVPPPEFFPKLQRICSQNDVVLIADEIQTGMGRTGKMFAMEHWGVSPDLTTVAKSLAAGMPLSAVVGKKEIMDTVHPSGVGGTYGGNPVSCAAALAVFEVMVEEDLLTRAALLGAKIHARLEDFQSEFEIIGDVRGLGAMQAVELVTDRESRQPAAEAAKAVTRFCLERGLILLSCGTFGNVLRLMMPLVITDDQLEKGFSILGDALSSVGR